MCIREREKIWSWWCLLVQWYHCIYTITVNIHNVKRTSNALMLPWKSLSPLLESLERSPELPEEGVWAPCLSTSTFGQSYHYNTTLIASFFRITWGLQTSVFLSSRSFHRFFLNSHLSVYINRILSATVFQLSFDFPSTKLV